MMPVHARLKRDTVGFHQQTERAFDHFDVRTPEGYRGFLLAQAGAFLPLERMAEQAGIGRLLPDWSERRRSDLLIADLGRLGVSSSAIPLRAIAETDLDPLGLAYVLEGSRHGGKLLLRRVLAGQDGATQASVSFLSQPLDGPRWRALLDLLERQGGSEHGFSALLAAIAAAFRLFETSALAGYGSSGRGSTSGEFMSVN